MEQSDRLAVVDKFFGAVNAADAEGLVDLFTEDFVLERPYSNGGMTIEGRDEVLSQIAAALKMVRFSLALTEVYPSADPDLVITEYATNGSIIATGKPHRNRYLGLWRFRDGRVYHLREFSNPLSLQSD